MVEEFQELARVEDRFSQGSTKPHVDDLFADGGLRVSGLFVLTDVNRVGSTQLPLRVFKIDDGSEADMQV